MSDTGNKGAIELLNKWLSYPEVEETPAAEEFRKRISGELYTEHARLQREVVKAAKEWRKLADDPDIPWFISQPPLLDALNALTDYESEHCMEGE